MLHTTSIQSLPARTCSLSSSPTPDRRRLLRFVECSTAHPQYPRWPRLLPGGAGSVAALLTPCPPSRGASTSSTGSCCFTRRLHRTAADRVSPALGQAAPGRCPHALRRARGRPHCAVEPGDLGAWSVRGIGRLGGSAVSPRAGVDGPPPSRNTFARRWRRMPLSARFGLVRSGARCSC
jgi:hypothetical protein